MAKHIQDIGRLPDPAKLADDTVLALSSVERGSKVSPKLLEEGIKLCDYLINLLEELEASIPQMGQWAFHSVRDKESLKESEIDTSSMRERLKEARKQINELIQNPFSHTSEQIVRLQELLITVTMPIWKNRTSEFRERKLKRGLIIYG